MLLLKTRLLYLVLTCGLLAGFALGEEIVHLSLNYVRPQLPPKVTPRPLEAMAGVHPRILLPEGGMAELIERGQTTHSQFVGRIREMADRIIERGPSPSANTERTGRVALRKPAQLAWAYAATGETKYRDAAIRFALACCEYPKWHIDVDLAASHGAVALSQVYDWFYHDMTEEQRTTIREKMRYQGNLLNSPFGPERVVGGTWWTQSYLQNHGMENTAGLAAAGIVFYEEIPEARDWLDNAERHMDKVLSICNDDGSSMEGMNYWAYGVEHLLLWSELAKSALGRDYFATSGHLRNLGRFFIGLSAPWMVEGDHVFPYGAPILSTGTHGPYHILFKSAAISRDRRVQDIAQATWDANLGSRSHMKTYCLLWYDPTVGRRDYKTSETTFVYPELGIATARSGWQEDATALWFKCGASQGRAADEVFGQAVSSGHARADQMSFQIITRGQRMTAYGNEYCANHSMIAFRGHYQQGENSGKGLDGHAAYAARQPKLLAATTSTDYDYFAGDDGGIYMPEAGLRRYRRHVVYLKPDTFLFVDDISMSSATSEAPDIDWRMSTLSQPARLSEDHYEIVQLGAAMDVYLCAPEGFVMAEEGPIDNRGYAVDRKLREIYRLRIHSVGETSKAILVTAIHCRNAADVPLAKPDVAVTGRTVVACVQLAVGPREVTIDLDRNTCTVRPAAPQPAATE